MAPGRFRFPDEAAQKKGKRRPVPHCFPGVFYECGKCTTNGLTQHFKDEG
jgi:hypothetical protein